MTEPAAMSLLTKEDEQRLFGLPHNEDEIIRFCTLDDDDLQWVMTHRRAANRLGFALQLCCLRHFGRLLERDERPPLAMLRYLAEQTDTVAQDFTGYGRRYETQRRHHKEIAARQGLSKVTGNKRESLIEWVQDRAIGVVDAAELIEAYLGECRQRHLVAPAKKHIDRVCRQALARARREICRRLIAGLPGTDVNALEALLQRHPGERISTLVWLRRAPQAARPGQILEALERLKTIQSLSIDRHRQDLVPRCRYHLLVEEARRVSVQHFRDMDKERRLATLLVAAIDIEQALLDHGVDLMGRFLANLFNRSEQDHAEGLQSKGKDIDGHLRLHADLVDVLSQAHQSGGDAIALIRDKLGWELVIESGACARTLVAGDAFNPLSELPAKYGSFRGVAAPFLQAYNFQSVASSNALLRAIDAIRSYWNHDVQELPNKLPTSFISRRWRRFVFNADGSTDRKYYEFCVFDTLFSRLRAGDVWIEGSRRYAAFEDGLIAPEIWQELAAQGHHKLAVETDFDAFLARIQNELNGRLSELDQLAVTGKLPDAIIDRSGLRIGRVEGLQDAKEAEPFARRLYATMPVVRITELLTEVDRWTGFSQSFTHLRTGLPAAEPQTLLSALLADGTNMSLTRMAEASHGFSVRQLAWMADWHLRPETYTSALATIVDAQHRQPLAARFGEMIVASSDGQHFRAGGPAEARSLVNAKYGREPGAAIYTHISGRYAPFHSRLIPASAGETPFVLGGLLDHGGDFEIETNHADTGGVSDHNFAITYLLGYRLAPRIRNLRDRRLYTFKPATAYPAAKPIIEGKINIHLLRETWDDLLRFAASLQNGSIDAATALKRLAAYPEQNRIASALRELGRIVRTLFTIDWILNPGLRRQATEELNKGEGRNNLARAVFHHRLGELRDRTAEAQTNRASGLNLLTSAIILWNTVYLERAIVAATTRKQQIPDHLIRHIAPLGWEHIILTGDYIWSFDPPKTADGYRLLRNANQSLLAA